MPLTWGFSSLGCPDLGLDAILALAGAHGFRAVELRFLNGSADLNAELSRFLSVAANAELVGASKVAISGLNTSYKLSSQDEGDLEAFKETAWLADRVQAGLLRVFDGPDFGQPLSAEGKAAAKRNFAEWKRWRADNGVRAEMALETHGATSSTDRTLEFFDLLGERLPLIWDTHHTMILGRERPEDTWKRISAAVRHVHIKDSADKPSARHPYTYVLPGQGRFPARKILDRLRADRFSGIVSLEWERKWHPYLPPLEDAFRAMDAAGWREKEESAQRKSTGP